jgi:N-acyl-D-aspartate/D-glutamate deacylase
MFDLLIRGGTLVDGTGAPRRRADVGVTGERIAAVGDLEGPARRVIDAEGLVVTPGFVDIHTHFDGQATWDPILAPSSWHGVTSVAMGNCGVGFAPARPDRHDWLIGLLEGVEDIPGTALAEGLTWEWETFPEYLDALERTPHTVDLGVHVPHAALRTYVMGDRGADHTATPSEGELAEMAALLAEALAAGALGFATSRTDVHRTRDGTNIGTLTATGTELLTFARVLAEAGRGVAQLISDAYQSPDDEFCARELDLIEAFARTSGRPLSFTVQQAYHSPDRWRDIFARIARWREAGLDIRPQVAPRPIGVLLGLEATANPFLLCASYADVAALPLAERVAALTDPQRRRRILAEHAELAAALPDGLLRQICCGFDVLFELGDPVDYELDASRSLAAQAARTGVPAAELVYDRLLADGGRRLLYLPLFNFAHRSFDDLYEMLTAEWSLLGLSDAGAHCGAICDASFPTTAITLWSRDRRGGPRIPLERMVAAQTSRTAAHVGWLDRGVVAPGCLADLNVINLERLACRPPRLVRDLPAGGRRLVQDAVGYRYTVKSGVVTFEDGEHTGALPGRLVRGRRPAPGAGPARTARKET